MQLIQLQENDHNKRRVYLHLVDATDGITPETGEAGNSAYVSLNGKTPESSINAIVAVDTTNQPGTYYLELAPSELKELGFVTVRYKSAETAEFVQIIQVVAFDPYVPQYGGNYGGADVDYSRIKKIIEESITSIPQPKEADFTPLSDTLQALLLEIRGIDIPKPEKTNLEPILKQLEAINASIKSIPQPDLDPITDRLDSYAQNMKPMMDETKKTLDAMLERIKQYYLGDIEDLKGEFSKLMDRFDDVSYVVFEQKNKDQPDTKKGNVLKEYLNL